MGKKQLVRKNYPNDWSDGAWDRFGERFKNSKIKGSVTNTINNDTERHVHRFMQTSPKNDTIWSYGDPEQELMVFKNMETGDYIYSHNQPGAKVEESRVTQLPDYIKKLIQWK